MHLVGCRCWSWVNARAGLDEAENNNAGPQQGQDVIANFWHAPVQRLPWNPMPPASIVDTIDVVAKAVGADSQFNACTHNELVSEQDMRSEDTTDGRNNVSPAWPALDIRIPPNKITGII